VLSTLQVKRQFVWIQLKQCPTMVTRAKINNARKAMFLNGTNFTTWLVQTDGRGGTIRNALITINHSILK